MIAYGDDTGFAYNTSKMPTMYRGKDISFIGNVLHGYGEQWLSYDGNTLPRTIAGLTPSYDENGTITSDSFAHYIYSHEGTLLGFARKTDGVKYFYRRDAQGNIVAILDNTGAVVVNYKYNAWGNHKVLNPDGTENTDAGFIGNRNPFRYRGYYYSDALGLYYLKSRFYDPEIGRFISADTVDYLAPDTINGLNLYAYCGNNPVMNVDPEGHAWWNWVISGAQMVAGAVLCLVPGAQPVGVALLVAGTTSMASNILTASGVEGKTASIILNVLDMAGGAALLFTPFAGLGANMIGSGALGLAGGFASEALGGSFELGSSIGNVVGGIVGGRIYRGLVNHKLISFKVSTDRISNNPQDPYCDPTIGPKQGAVVEKIRRIQQTGKYDTIAVVKLSTGGYQVQNGHHTLRALKSLGYKYVWVRLT